MNKAQITRKLEDTGQIVTPSENDTDKQGVEVESLILHEKLQNWLKKEIIEGKIVNRIPTERELAEKFSVSRNTVRRAINALVQEGILESRRGSGTFTHHRPVEEWLGNLTTYNKVIEDLGMEPGTRLINHGVIKTPAKLVKTFGKECYFINRLRLADKTPIALEQQYYPLEIGQRLAKFDLNEIILYETLEESLGVKLKEAEQTIACAKPNAEEASHLGINKNTSVLVIERMTKDFEDNLIEHLRSLYVSDRYKFHIKLTRNASYRS